MVEIVLAVAIVVSAAEVIISSDRSIAGRLPDWFWLIEATAVGIFIIEYAARIYSCTSQPDLAEQLLQASRNAVHSLAFSPDGQTLISGQGGGALR
ncbi:MAG: hypothetical protein AAF085_14940, partial [Planctomycetota bacterium]